MTHVILKLSIKLKRVTRIQLTTFLLAQLEGMQNCFLGAKSPEV